MLTDEERRLVAENRGHDPAKLALSLRSSAVVRSALVAQQVDAYNRLEGKVPSWADFDGLEFPFPVAIQQCSSEPLARFRKALAADAKSVIDLTGGLGVDCYFIGQGKESVTYVDASAEAVSAARWNFAILGVKNTAFVNQTAEEFVESAVETGRRADLIFIDPSRRGVNGERVYKLQDCAPDVTKLAPLMVRVADCVMVKLSPLLDISQTLAQLPNATDIYAIGHGGECKDIVVCLMPGRKDCERQTIHAVTLDDDGECATHIRFTKSEECATAGNIATAAPTAGDYLFVPSAAIMKAGPFNILSVRYGAKLIARDTHIYTSDADITEFPGRRFKVMGAFDLSKRSIAELRETTDSASIAVRNFPLTADALRKKLKLRESSVHFLFGVTGCDGRPLLLLCTKAK
ncbi:MAG: RsmD family RNA methyltransferase [Marinilabiliaceae bacterium]